MVNIRLFTLHFKKPDFYRSGISDHPARADESAMGEINRAPTDGRMNLVISIISSHSLSSLRRFFQVFKSIKQDINLFKRIVEMRGDTHDIATSCYVYIA
jgi:hypothetical protein